MKKYQIIYADPPWYYPPQNHKYNLTAPYKLMTDDELINFTGVTDNLEKDGILFMWSTIPRLDFALILISKWGLSYRGLPWVWVKTNKDGKVMGAKGPQTNIVKPTCELLLCATWSKKCKVQKTKDQKIRNVLFAQRREHSRKPDEVYEYLERMYPSAKKLELFARRKRDGWDVWGNEVESDIKIESTDFRAVKEGL